MAFACPEVVGHQESHMDVWDVVAGWALLSPGRFVPHSAACMLESSCHSVPCSPCLFCVQGSREVAGDCGAGDIMTSEVIEDEKQFYSKAKTYWKQIPPTVDGMLGGYGHISSIDLNSSRKFLQRFLRVGRSDVLSRRGCGSGGAVWGATSIHHTAGSLSSCWWLPPGP